MLPILSELCAVLRNNFWNWRKTKLIIHLNEQEIGKWFKRHHKRLAYLSARGGHHSLSLSSSSSELPSLSENWLAFTFPFEQATHLQILVEDKFAFKHAQRLLAQPFLQEHSMFSKIPSGAGGKSIQFMVTLPSSSTSHPWLVISGQSTMAFKAFFQIAAW